MDAQTQQILSYIWPLIVLQLGTQIYALVDLIRRKTTKTLTLPIWVVIILAGNMFGAIAYLIVGKADELTSD
jgi:hypothetical protein